MKRSAEADPGVSAPFPANIKMENIDYGKTQIKYLTKSKDTKDKVNSYAPDQSQITKIQSTFLLSIERALSFQDLGFKFLLKLFLFSI